LALSDDWETQFVAPYRSLHSPLGSKNHGPCSPRCRWRMYNSRAERSSATFFFTSCWVGVCFKNGDIWDFFCICKISSVWFPTIKALWWTKEVRKPETQRHFRRFSSLSAHYIITIVGRCQSCHTSRSQQVIASVHHSPLCPSWVRSVNLNHKHVTSPIGIYWYSMTYLSLSYFV
jgi:hypothetical protein